MKKLLMIGCICLLPAIVSPKSSDYRSPTIKEVQDLHQIKATKLMIEALQATHFAASLDCPCYTVIMSSITNGYEINVNKKKCLE